MGYVALSRVRSLKYLILDGLNGMALRVSPMAKEIDAELRRKSREALEEHAVLVQTWQDAEASGENERKMEEASHLYADPDLMERLKEWRANVAKEKNIAPFMVAANKALESVAAMHPQNEQELLNVPGFGSKKVETYGPDILEIVQEAAKAKSA
jgi:superfamily II DNA helicase RecQ